MGKKIKYLKIRKSEWEKIKSEREEYHKWYKEEQEIRRELQTKESTWDWRNNEHIKILQNELSDWKIFAGGFCPNRNPFEGNKFTFPKPY